MGYVDLHSHVLPGLDDGAPALPASMAMLRGLVELGFERVCATPHQKTGFFLPSPDQIDRAAAEVRSALADGGVTLDLIVAAENMWDATLYQRMEDDSIPCYGQSRAFLMEFPVDQLPVALLNRIFDLRRRGLLPVLAHPERYRPLWGKLDEVEAIGRECALVVDLGAVAGHHGRREAKAARRMLKEGLVHAVASDIHSPADLRGAREGMAWIQKRLGQATLDRLLDSAPRRILAGEHPTG